MALWSVGGGSGSFTWSAVYDDVANTLTLQADGPGRCTVVVEQNNGQRGACFFVQPGGNPLPLPAGLTVQSSVTVPIGAGPVAMTGIRLKPTPDKGAGQGGFIVTNEEWRNP